MYPGWWQDVMAMLLFRMDLQREPVSHEARVELPGPRLRMRRRSSCSEEPLGQAPAIPNSHGAPFARTRRAVVFSETAVVHQEMAPGSAALLSRHPASLCTAPGEPSALLAHSFRAWASRTFPAAAKEEGRVSQTCARSPVCIRRCAVRWLDVEKALPHVSQAAASSIDAPQLSPPAETSSAAADQAELGRLRALLATADAERLLLIERA